MWTDGFETKTPSTLRICLGRPTHEIIQIMNWSYPVEDRWPRLYKRFFNLGCTEVTQRWHQHFLRVINLRPGRSYDCIVTTWWRRFGALYHLHSYPKSQFLKKKSLSISDGPFFVWSRVSCCRRKSHWGAGPRKTLVYKPPQPTIRPIKSLENPKKNCSGTRRLWWQRRRQRCRRSRRRTWRSQTPYLRY